MGILSDLVSDTFGDTSDVEGRMAQSQSPDFKSGTDSMVNSIMGSSDPAELKQIQSTAEADGGSGGGSGGGGGIIGMAMSMMSDVNSKTNITIGKEQLDKILNTVYLRLKVKRKHV